MSIKHLKERERQQEQEGKGLRFVSHSACKGAQDGMTERRRLEEDLLDKSWAGAFPWLRICHLFWPLS